jgi:hypothetical protein
MDEMHAILREGDFRKSSFSGDASTCVQIAFRDGVIGVRDSKHPHDGVLTFSTSEWSAFLKGVKAGEFDFN